jgi:hypothetical protein
MFLSPGYVKLPSCLDPLGPEEEVNLLLDLIRELNEKFMLELDEDVELADKLLVDQEEAVVVPKRYLVVGNSHANRVACALEDLGLDAKLISAAGWAGDPELNNSIAQLVKEEVELAEGELVIIYFLYDNEVYVVDHEDGEQTAPIKMSGSNKYHINGKLGVVDREKFKELFNISVPILRAGGDCAKLVISPLLRYITAPCCREAGHLTNFGGPEYAMLLGEAVENMKGWLRDLTFGKRIRNFKVVCSNTCIGFDEDEEVEKKKKLKEYWTSDPVHLSAAGYGKLASDIVKKGDQGMTRSVVTSEKRKEKVDKPTPAPKRARWIEDDEVTAPRDLGGHGGRGKFGWRGRGRGRGWGPRGGGGFRSNRGGHRGRFNY